MKVVFLESVEGTAQAGDVKEVKGGFARNFLLPRGLAAPAMEPYLTRAGARAAREAKHQEALDREAETTAARLEGARITIEARVGEQGKLYGSVTGVHIADEVAKLIGQEEFDHRKVLLPEAIKETGVQPVRLRLTRNVEAAIEVEVLAEGEEPEAAVVDESLIAETEEPSAEAAEEASDAQEAVDAEADIASETAERPADDEEAADEDADKS